MDEDSLMNQWNKVKRTNISIIEVSEKERGWARNIFGEIMVANFSNLRKKQTFRSRKPREAQIRWTQRNPWQDIRWLKCQKLKIENLKGTMRKKLVTYKGTPFKKKRESWFFSRNYIQARMAWNFIKVLMENKNKNKNLQSRILYLARLSLRVEGKRVLQTSKI